jgi:hypothetical protein
LTSIVYSSFSEKNKSFVNIWLDPGKNKEGQFSLLPADEEFPLRVHMGDFDQDGYVDGLAIMVDRTDEEKKRQASATVRQTC